MSVVSNKRILLLIIVTWRLPSQNTIHNLAIGTDTVYKEAYIEYIANYYPLIVAEHTWYRVDNVHCRHASAINAHLFEYTQIHHIILIITIIIHHDDD